MIGGNSAQAAGSSIYLSSEWPSERNNGASRQLGNSAPFMRQSSLNPYNGNMILEQYDGGPVHLRTQMSMHNSSQQMFSVPQVPAWSHQDNANSFRKESVSDSATLASSATLLGTSNNDTVDTDLLTQNVLREMRNGTVISDDDDDDDDERRGVGLLGRGNDDKKIEQTNTFLPVISGGSQDAQKRYISILEDTIRGIQECVRDSIANEMCREPFFEQQSAVSQLYQRIESILRSHPETMHLMLSSTSPEKYSSPLDFYLAPQGEKGNSLNLSSTLMNSSPSPLAGSSASPQVISLFNSSQQSLSPGTQQQQQPSIIPPSSDFLQPPRGVERSASRDTNHQLANSGATVNPLLFAASPMAPVESSRTRFVTSAPVFVPRGDSPSVHSPKRKGMVSVMGGIPQRSPSPQGMGISLEDINEPEDVKGHVVQMTQYQAGCRYLQKQLDALEGPRKQHFVQIVFNEVLSVLPQVITDTYGQYLIPKLMEHSNDAQRRAMIAKLAPDVKHIACHSFGSHGLQRSLQFLQDEQVQLLGDALKQHVSALCKDQKGNYLIQCFVKIFGPGSRVEFIFQLLTSELVDIAKHKVGCTVICRCLENADDQQTRAIVNKVLTHALPFARDEFANYVVQHIILHCAKTYSSALINAFRGHAKSYVNRNLAVMSWRNVLRHLIVNSLIVSSLNSQLMIFSRLYYPISMVTLFFKNCLICVARNSMHH